MKSFNKFVLEKYNFKIRHNSLSKPAVPFKDIKGGKEILWAKIDNNRSYPYMSFKAFKFTGDWIEKNGEYTFTFYNDENEIEEFYSVFIPKNEMQLSFYEKSSQGSIHILSTSVYNIIEFFDNYKNDYPRSFIDWFKKKNRNSD